ncbi:MAG: hypothetical protein WCV72_00015 [Patescibacteria group bacterium]
MNKKTSSLVLGYIYQKETGGETLNLVDVYFDGEKIGTVLNDPLDDWQVFEIEPGKLGIFNESRVEIHSILSGKFGNTLE